MRSPSCSTAASARAPTSSRRCASGRTPSASCVPTSGPRPRRPGRRRARPALPAGRARPDPRAQRPHDDRPARPGGAVRGALATERMIQDTRCAAPVHRPAGRRPCGAPVGRGRARLGARRCRRGRRGRAGARPGLPSRHRCSAVATRRAPRPWPSKRGSTSVWVKATSPGRRRYSAKPASSPPTRTSKREACSSSTTTTAPAVDADMVCDSIAAPPNRVPMVRLPACSAPTHRLRVAAPRAVVGRAAIRTTPARHPWISFAGPARAALAPVIALGMHGGSASVGDLTGSIYKVAA